MCINMAPRKDPAHSTFEPHTVLLYCVYFYSATMDCYTAVSDLKKLLVAHSNTENQVAVLDSKIDQVSQRILESTIDGDRSQDLHLSLRQSVSEGVRLMYNSYQNNKWAQVQATARSIIDNLEGDLDSSPMTSPLTSSPTRGSTPADKAADKWSMAFCEFYRDE